MNPSAVPDIADETLTRLRCGIRLLALHELRDADAADEVAQETLARVVHAWREGQVRDPERLGAFARGVARHVVVDVMRKRRREVPLSVVRELSNEDVSQDALTTLVTDEQLRAVRAALDTLNAADRELIRLAYFEGLTSEDLALRFHEPAARIRKRKERAMERLRKAFAQKPRHTSAARATGQHVPVPLVGPRLLTTD